MGKFILNLSLGEPISMMKKLPYFDDLIEFDALLAGSLIIGVHDLIKFHCSMQYGLSSVGTK
jgi:hypothetical protein